MDVEFSPHCVERQKQRKVTDEEVVECFTNITGGFLMDAREEHQSNPPTHWFISHTELGRKLFVAFIQMPDLRIVVKTVFEPEPERVTLYKNLTRRK